MDEFTREQRQRNLESASGWESYASHRDIITRLVLDAAPDRDATLTVLGAGNCNDLDLTRIAARFSNISLVDLDRKAVEAAMARQRDEIDLSRIHIYECDVTGIFPELSSLRTTGAINDRVRELTRLAENSCTNPLPDPASVVISTGLITQLVEATINAVGEEHLAQLDSPGVSLLQTVRRRHLRLLSELTQPGGTAILTTEVVSSDTAPGICNTPSSDLPDRLQGCLAAGNFFTGLHPGILYTELTSGKFTPEFESVETTSPWLWQFTARTYAVVAFIARRKQTQIPS